MTAAQLPLAEAMAARLCHDFAGLTGTIVGMLEWAEGPDQPDALALARQAAEALARRLRLTRAAYGELARWDETAWPRLAADLATERVDVWFDETAFRRGRAAAVGRLLVNAVLLGRVVLRERGRIVVAAGPADPALTVTLAGAGPAAVCWPEMPWAGGITDPARFQLAWTALTATADRFLLRVEGARLHVRLV